MRLAGDGDLAASRLLSETYECASTRNSPIGRSHRATVASCASCATGILLSRTADRRSLELLFPGNHAVLLSILCWGLLASAPRREAALPPASVLQPPRNRRQRLAFLVVANALQNQLALRCRPVPHEYCWWDDDGQQEMSSLSHLPSVTFSARSGNINRREGFLHIRVESNAPLLKIRPRPQNLGNILFCQDLGYNIRTASDNKPM